MANRTYKKGDRVKLTADGRTSYWKTPWKDEVGQVQKDASKARQHRALVAFPSLPKGRWLSYGCLEPADHPAQLQLFQEASA